MKSSAVSNIIMRVYIMEGMYSVALGQILAKCCQVVCGDHYPVQHSNALKAPAVGESRLAKELEEIHCSPEDQSSLGESEAL